LTKKHKRSTLELVSYKNKKFKKLAKTYKIFKYQTNAIKIIAAVTKKEDYLMLL